MYTTYTEAYKAAKYLAAQMPKYDIGIIKTGFRSYELEIIQIDFS